MKKIIIVTIVAVCFALSVKAQHEKSDTIVPERIIVKCSSLGLTYMNNLDTYLSGYNHTGRGLYFSHENFRDARTGDYRWKYQTLLTANIGTTKLHDNNQLSSMVNYSWSGYHPFKKRGNLQLLAGAQIQMSGGALYIPTNGNNLVSVKLRTAIAASGMIIYHIPSKRGDFILRSQLDIPIAGVMFAPEFGQSYYEIFGLEKYDNTLSFSHPINSPSCRLTLSSDIPVKWRIIDSTLRFSYIADIFQSDINDIRTHLYNHAFTIGIVKTIYKVKKADKRKYHSPF